IAGGLRHADARREGAVACDAAHGGRRTPKRLYVSRREFTDVSRTIEPLERIQRIGIANVERPEHVGVEDREDARVEADAQPDGEDHAQREDGRASDATRGIPYIGEQILKG